MRIVVMQPYHWPSAEHLFMASLVDAWVFLDTVQLTRKSWMTRNRLRGSDASFWFGPKVKHTGNRIQIVDAEVFDADSYRKKLKGSIRWYQANTPNGDEVKDIVDLVLEEWTGNSLAELNVLSSKAFFDWMGLSVECFVASEMKRVPESSTKSRWALDTAVLLGASEVVNPKRGVSLFDIGGFRSSGVGLRAYECGPIASNYASRADAYQYLSWIDSAASFRREELEALLRLHASVEVR